MTELKTLGIAENTLVILMADNGPMTHNGPPGMVETLYRGGKGDYLEGGVRVPAMAWWPSVIAPGQIVGDIIHETDLFTTFAHLAGAMEHVPTDRIIDGIDQTALFLKGDTFSRRDYVFIYTGDVLAATVKGRYKRVWVGEHPGLSGAAFYDLYTDPREVSPKMLPMFPAKGMFSIMKTRHELWTEKYPNAREARSFPANRHRECTSGDRRGGASPRGCFQASVRSVRVHEVAPGVERNTVRSGRVMHWETTRTRPLRLCSRSCRNFVYGRRDTGAEPYTIPRGLI